MAPAPVGNMHHMFTPVYTSLHMSAHFHGYQHVSRISNILHKYTRFTQTSLIFIEKRLPGLAYNTLATYIETDLLQLYIVLLFE